MTEPQIVMEYQALENSAERRGMKLTTSYDAMGAACFMLAHTEGHHPTSLRSLQAVTGYLNGVDQERAMRATSK